MKKLIDNRFENKVVMITGGSSGIGKATALEMGKRGAKVAVIASSSLEKAALVSTEIVNLGGISTPFVADLSKVDEIKIVVKSICEAFGKIDILVNSAGVFYPTVVGNTTEKDYNRMVDINMKSMFFAIDEVAPIMKGIGGGKIVNVASIAAYVTSKDYGLYSAVKVGIVSLTKAFALQLAPYGINVNAVAPGNTATPINQDIRNNPEYAARRDMIDSQTPSKRNFSEPEDIANVIIFLASDDSIAIHGTTVLADEGRAAGM